MTKRQRRLQDKNNMRDIMTGKRVGNKEVVIVDNAVDYVKKLGYVVMRPKFIGTISLFIIFMMTLLLFFSARTNYSISTENNIITHDQSKALTFNPEYIQDQKYPDLVIKNGANTIIRLKLIDNSEQCLTDCYAIINVTNTISGALPNSFDFKDEKGNGRSSDYRLYFLNYTLKNVTSIYQNYSCPKGITYNPADCVFINNVSSSTIVRSQDWVLYTGQTFPVGNHTLKIVGNKKANESIDWGFDYQGFLSDDVRQYWAWWNNSWLYKQKIDIAGSVTLNDSIKLVIPKSANMKSDYSDLRFLNGSENSELYYWIYQNNSNNATIYVKLLDNSSIYMYYGNSLATSKSDQVNVEKYAELYGITTTGFTGTGTGSNRGGQNSTFNYTTDLTYIRKLAGDTSTRGYVSDGARNIIYLNTTFDANGFINVTTGLRLNATQTYSFLTDNGGLSRAYNLSGLSYNPPYFRSFLTWWGAWDSGGAGAYLTNYIMDIWGVGGVIVTQATYTTQSELSSNSSPIMTFISQIPADITTTNIISNNLNISYSATPGSNPLNASTIKLFTKTNSTSRNKLIFVNGSTRASNDANSFFNLDVNPANVSNNFTFSINDNEVYPASYNLDQDIIENTTHSFFTAVANGGVKIEILNISSTSQYNLFEIMANNSGTGNLVTYYCNSTYTTGNPATNTNCALFGSLTPTITFNHTESSNSSHQIFPFAVINGSVGSVVTTSTSYFLAYGPWNYYYVANPSRSTASATTNNNGVTYSAQTWTFDAHVHQYSGSDQFYYYACINDTMNLQGCSSVRNDSLDLTLLPPTAVNVYNPQAQTYNGTIYINYTSAFSPQNSSIYYNISVVNSSLDLVIVVTSNNSNNLSSSFDSNVLSDGNYIVKVQAIDSNNLSSSSFSSTFTILNHPFNVLTAKSFLNIDVTTNSGVLLFLLMIVISVCTLIWIHYELGSMFLLIVGFIALINIPNLFIGFSLIVISIVLIAMKDSNQRK